MSKRITYAIVLLVISPALARGQACAWSSVSGGGGPSSPVTSAVSFDDGSGPALYVASSNPPAVLKWDGTTWTTVGSLFNAGIRALKVFDDGTGPELYAGGSFFGNGSTGFFRHIAKWDGSTSSWTNVGAGVPRGGFASGVTSLEVFDDGTGPALYAGGLFVPPGLLAYGVMKWDGAAWSTLNLWPTINGLTSWVRSLAVFNDGTGSALYAGGDFLAATMGSPSDHIAKWDGTTWSGVGGGLDDRVSALAVFDDGTGPALYAGGEFLASTGGIPSNHIAKWDGNTWSAVGSGAVLGGVLNDDVRALPVFDDGAGSALYAGGDFLATTGGITSSGIAKWDGVAWAGVGGGLRGIVFALAGFDDGSGEALYVGGTFISTTAWLPYSNFIARWSCPPIIQPSPIVISQNAPGAPILLQNTNLIPGHEYYNVFSVEMSPPSGLGAGPYLGLYASTPAALELILYQLRVPIGLGPVHFFANNSSETWGPFLVPPSAFEAVTFDFTGGVLVAASATTQFVVQ